METKIIEISGSNYFKSWQIVLGIILPICMITFAINGEFIYIKFSLIAKILMIVFSVVLFVVCCFTKSLYEFDSETKKFRKGVKLFSYKRGIWQPFEADCDRFAFQKYEENVNYDYGGLTNKDVYEVIFELRKIKGNNFETIVRTSDFESVKNIVQLGIMLSSIYNVPFSDYVKGIARKKYHKS